MDILLIDFHHEGHHLEYASKLQTGLQERYPDSKIDFLTLCPIELQDQYFSEEEIEYIYEDRKEINPFEINMMNNIFRALSKPRDDFLSEGIDSTNGYDIIHFLHIDDITQELLRHGPKIDSCVLASINGGFFRNQSKKKEKISKYLIEYNLDPLSKYIPNILSRRGPWNILSVNELLNQDVIERLFVSSKPGMELLQDTCDRSKQMIQIPDPIEPWYKSKDNKNMSREKLGIPKDEFVFVLFGELRHEKGVDILLDAIQMYDGPEIYCVIAGEPTDIAESDIESIKTEKATIKYDLEYIPKEKVQMYYEASDCMLFPYRPSFGRFRRSGTFQKACAAGKPVIVSDFGIFKQVVSDRGFGATFTPNSPEALSLTMANVVNDVEQVSDEEKMYNYAKRHTYDTLVDVSASTYEEVMKS